MAIGDSITTGFGIHGPSGLLNEFRGESWAIGTSSQNKTDYALLLLYTHTEISTLSTLYYLHI